MGNTSPKAFTDPDNFSEFPSSNRKQSKSSSELEMKFGTLQTEKTLPSNNESIA